MRFETFVDFDRDGKLRVVISHHSARGFVGGHSVAFDNGLHIRYSVPKRIANFRRYVKRYVRHARSI